MTKQLRLTKQIEVCSINQNNNVGHGCNSDNDNNMEDSTDRDELLHRILTGIRLDDRGMFLKFCMCQLPVINEKKVKLIDFMCFIATLYHAKILDIHSEDWKERNELFSKDYFVKDIDDDGHITSLSIEIDDLDCDFTEFNTEHDDYVGYVLPETLGYLTKLERLIVWQAGSLPKCLASLKHLKHLGLYHCNDLSSQIVSQPVSLPNVECLTVVGCEFRSAPPSDFFEWMGNCLPNLTDLEFSNICKHSTAELIIDTLCNLKKYNNAAKLYTRLNKFGFVCSNGFSFEPNKYDFTFDEILLKKLFNSVFQQFSSLEKIDLSSNDISFQSISSVAIPSSITSINLYGTMENNTIETNAIVKFLEKNSNVICLSDLSDEEDYHIFRVNPYDPKIEYGLLQNQAGRNIIQKSRQSSNSNSNIDHTQMLAIKDQYDAMNHDKIILPPSIVPFYLERAYDESDQIYRGGISSKSKGKDPTGIYYLLQELGTEIFGHTNHRRHQPHRRRRRHSGPAGFDRRIRRRRAEDDGNDATML